MNSKNLVETGFTEWFPLKTLTHSNLPADQGLVVVIVDNELSGKQESDILYIGRTKKTVKKIFGGYLGGYGGKSSKKINQMLFNEGYIEKASIGWMKTDKPRIMQEELLMKYKGEHNDVPAWNAKKRPNIKLKQASFKSNQAQAYKKKPAPSEVKTTPKPSAKPKTASSRKPKATLAASEKAETKKEVTGAEAPETAKSSGTGVPT